MLTVFGYDDAPHGHAEVHHPRGRLAELQGPSGVDSDYLVALRGRASRRQATRDLASAEFLQRVGATRGARYLLRHGAGTS